MNTSLPTHFKIVTAFSPKTTNAALTSQVITLKGALKAWLILNFTQAVGFAYASRPFGKRGNVSAVNRSTLPWCGRHCFPTPTGARYS